MAKAADLNKKDRRTPLAPLEGLKIVEELTNLVLADPAPNKAAGIAAAQKRWRELLDERKILSIVAVMITGKFQQALNAKGLKIVRQADGTHRAAVEAAQ